MIRISILYPNRAGSRFDFRYYLQTHMPMSIERLGTHSGFRSVSVERGIDGGPGTETRYVAVCHFVFESLADFMDAFGPHAATLQGDMPHYTDIEPVIQVSEVLLRKERAQSPA